MKNVFIAVGGSGAKVAEALVRLLAVGFPTHADGGLVTSAGDSLQIWRVDPDRSSGAAVALQQCIREYVELQKYLGDGTAPPGVASSRWAIDLDTRVRYLDPLQLPRAAENDNEIKTLRGVLDSQYGGKRPSAPLLAPFYEPKDLDVVVDRGFYQKPFIGAAVMAIFADSLNDETTPCGKEASLTAFNNNQANFFLCGSLHGGTGACGVPVMGRFLGERKKRYPDWGWRVGGCLLAPYCVPPQPPFKALREGETLEERAVDSMLERFGDEPAFAELTLEEKRELVKQILLGFYAEPEDMEARARQGLSYYKDHSADYFDGLYLVGKPEPDKLRVWSNGGQSQNNPLNSAEVVAALAALDFFSGAGSPAPHSYTIGASGGGLDSQHIALRDLPKYRVGPTGQEIDPEKVFLATAVAHHLLVQQIPWADRAKAWNSIEGLRALYADDEVRKESDRAAYFEAARLITASTQRLLDPQTTLGWSGEDARQLWNFLSPDPRAVRDVGGRMAKKFMSKEPKGAQTLGQSQLKVSTFEFGEWSPPGDQFSRGEYLRHVWSHLFEKAQDMPA
jgi:hypothetical protein